MAREDAQERPPLILYVARYQYAHKNAVAATLAWVAASRKSSFEVYYDAVHTGGHYGGGDPNSSGLGSLTGGLVSGGRHLEAVALALQRFHTTVLCSGEVAFANTLAALSESSGAAVYQASEDNIVTLYETLFSALGMSWPETAVMLNKAPSSHIDGIDAYCYPEIFYREAMGIESTARPAELQALFGHGIREMLTCGISKDCQQELRDFGFHVRDLNLIREDDDYASITYRLAKQWQDQRRGWIIGDPTLVAYWLPTACRENRVAIYSIPQSRVITLLHDDIAANTVPILGRQFEDEDFFTLSRLGQSFQLIDPCRPPLPVLQTIAARWSSSAHDPHFADPTDEELRTYAQHKCVLVSLVFWTGMIRETENLFALMDLLALTGLRAGIALTAQSLAWRPSPLDLLSVPREQGGVFPNVEILLASCGTGAAIESLLSSQQLAHHLQSAQHALERLHVPGVLRPEGWWTTMDAPLLELPAARATKRVRYMSTPPYVQFRYRRRDPRALRPSTVDYDMRGEARRHEDGISEHFRASTLQLRIREAVRDSRLGQFFEPYRPYENFEPGPFLPELGAAARRAGLSYMLTKSGFGKPPHIVYRHDDFVALNYTAGRWDGWTPFETINSVRDLRRAERTLRANGQPGWLLGGIDTCLWAFSGELWNKAQGLADIATYVASGGSSGKLINVLPRVLARYARLTVGELDRPSSWSEGSSAVMERSSDGFNATSKLHEDIAP